MRRTLLALGGVAMLATACGSSHPTTAPTTAPTPTTTAAPPVTVAPTTTTTAIDTAVVPPTITVAYVNAVLAQLNHIYGDAVRATVKADKVTPLTVHYLQEIYNQQLGAAEQGDFTQTLTGGLQNVRAVPGDPITSVLKLVSASPSCIYAEVRTNSDPIVIHPVPSLASEFMGLRHRALGAPTSGRTTPWIFFYDAVTKAPSNIPNQCPAT